MVVNAHFHPFGVQPAALNVVLAIAVAATLARLLATSARGARSCQPSTQSRWH